ncbi:hypothetical protein Bpfe_022304 [Biomphalaria pfeifferi]|uniref:Uncharacterized protein n=1 Tax=Biomphalaria pfeifferi TaxID=112525 RepID=A0AAD8B556_BIOPF|nr:hypothetical protein Bpfe_022304 [Biomphalaria pfeifferi]
MLTYQSTHAHLPEYPCSPTRVPMLTYQSTHAHLPEYPCSPTRVPMLTYQSTHAHFSYILNPVTQSHNMVTLPEVVAKLTT